LVRIRWLAAWVTIQLLLGACAADSGAGGGGGRVPKNRGAIAGRQAAGGAGGADFGDQTRAGSVARPPMQPSGPATAPVGDRQKRVVDDCEGSAPGAAALTAPNLAASSARWLYPYAETVFPRGLTAPVLQWSENPSGANAVMIQLRSMLLDYRVCLPLGEAANVQIPQEAWEMAAEQSLGKGDSLSIDVAIASGSSAVKLPTVPVVFALAKLKGAVYYNTYGSSLASQMGVIGGVVMRILPGKPEPEVFLTAPNPVTNCIGCHAVSADGTRMVAELHGQPGLTEDTAASFDIKAAAGGVNPPPLSSSLKRTGFAALYPDGSMYVTTGRLEPGPIGSVLGAPVGNVPGTFGPETSKLYDTNTGNEIAGSGVAEYAYMPMFSVDGKQLVFNQVDMSGANAGHTLGVMDFDAASKKFSGARTVFMDPTRFPGWPFFLPDVQTQQDELNVIRGKRVVFALGEYPDFVTQEQPVGLTPHVSDLYWVDLDSGKSAMLARASGLDASGASTLPYGDRDAHKNYIPTVSPVAAGGYFWVFFTSKRNYGNLFMTDLPEQQAEAKKIWVSAIDIDAAPGTDPSHPAFFLPGQEIDSGNIRAFAALEPCRENGTACESGVDCCCGYCIDGACGCRQGCAMIDEKCDDAGDCCTPGARCIGGFCEFVVE
jgi:hypothetical protein